MQCNILHEFADRTYSKRMSKENSVHLTIFRRKGKNDFEGATFSI